MIKIADAFNNSLKKKIIKNNQKPDYLLQSRAFCKIFIQTESPQLQNVVGFLLFFNNIFYLFKTFQFVMNITVNVEEKIKV